MFQRIVFVSALIISVSCMVIHRSPMPILIRIPQESDSNYNFAYEVNDYNSGDIKSQAESRRGDTVLGQYSLLQPDGVKRTVDYRADDVDGFKATVTNDGKPVNNNNNDNANEEDLREALEEQRRILNEEAIQQILIHNIEVPSSFIIQTIPNSYEKLISSVHHQ